MYTHLHMHIGRQRIRMVAVAAASALTAFFLGTHTVGDVHPLEQTQASVLTERNVPGDADGDDIISIRDALFVLEVLQNTTVDAPGSADVDRNGRVTLEDALWIFQALAH